MQIDWREYSTNYWIALRTHTLKYAPDTVEPSRERLGRLTFYFNIAKGVALVIGLLVVEVILGHPITTTVKALGEFVDTAFCGLQQLLN